MPAAGPARTSLHSRLFVLVALALGAPLAAQTADQTAIQVSVATSLSPPSLTFSWPNDPTATSYSVSRRLPGTTSWGTGTAIPGGGAATTWTDFNVVAGARYEYWFSKSGNPPGRGLVTAGVEASMIEDRGVLVLLVDGSHASTLATRIDRLIQDLVGDGWSVLRHDVLPTDAVVTTKTIIRNDVLAYPGQVKCVFLLGHVPVPYSGAINPDGHPDHLGAWPADVYYGELDGPWTDATVNVTTASRVENQNIPGDGKFDQSLLPSDVDLAVGRVDLANMPSFALSEDALLQQYLDKDHDYRQKVFAVGQSAVIDDNFGYFGGEAFAASGWRNFAGLVGAANVVAADYFTTLDTTTGNGCSWSYGCGGGSYTGAGGIGSTANFTASTNRCVFTMLFGSYFGDWNSTDNFLRAPLCSGWTLADAWAGRPHWSFHPMALGETLGTCARLSQNDTTAGGYGTRFVHVALMGDPTLRQHVIAPPANVAVTDLWPQASVSWTASVDAVAGYHVYRSPSPLGPFTRLTAAAVAGTVFTDSAPLAGDSTYMVRALRLETTPSGSYWNLSQGAFATQRLPQVAASNTNYGTGCYTLSDSFYQYFATPAAAAAALNGTSITLTPNGSGYDVTAGGGTYVAPSMLATVLALGDDDQTSIATPSTIVYPGGSASTLYVHANGIVATAPLTMPPTVAAVPAVTTFLGEATTAWYCWHDYDPTEPGSGSIKVHDDGSTLYVTWEGVESHPANVANPSTLQFQFEFATGVVRYVWLDLTPIGTGQASAPSEQHLIGWSPGGPSTDAGSIDLASGLPLSIGNANLEPLRLSASPPPISTASSGTVLVYSIDNIPAWTPGSHLGFLVLSLTPSLLGDPLASYGMPGCSSYVGSLDVFLAFAGSAPSQTMPLNVPAQLPAGIIVYAAALAAVQPGSLPNGMNPFGGVTSNGVASLVNDH